MYLKKLIQIPIFPELKNLNVMIRVFIEFSGAFTDYDCEINVVNNIDNLQDGGIILLDDAAGNYINNKNIYIEMAKKCPNSIFICWYWDKLPYFQPFNKMIFTGEFNLINNYINKNKLNYFNLNNYVPLRLRANESISNIGLYTRNNQRDYCFMGGGYKKNWIPQEFTGIYHEVFKDNYLDYDTRKHIYLTSIFALGFQSDDNIKNGHFSQRIFEGLVYGCIVLCENKLVTEFTEGSVVYISSKEDLIEKMKFYKNNPELIIKKQNEGYEWCKKYGTNRHSLSFFLDKIKTLYEYEYAV